MPGLTDYSVQNVLQYVTGKKTVPALPAVFVGLFTTAPTSETGSLATNGAVEVSGGSYARVQAAGTLATSASTATSSGVLTFASVPTWIVAGMSAFDATTTGAITGGQTVTSTTGTTVTLSANVNATVASGDTIDFSAFAVDNNSGGTAPGTTPGNVTNNSIITFPSASASWGTVTSFGLFDAVSGNTNLLAWDFLGNFGWLPTTCSAVGSGNGTVLTNKAHGYSNGDPVVFTTKYNGTLPTFTQQGFGTGAGGTGTGYGILTVANGTTDTFTVTNNAAAVFTSTTGDGQVRKIVQQSIPSGVTASFAVNAMTISLA